MFKIDRKAIEKIIKTYGYVVAIRKVRADGFTFETAKGIVFEIMDVMKAHLVKTKPISAVRIYTNVSSPLDIRANEIPPIMVNFDRKFQRDNLTVHSGNRWSNIGEASLQRLTRALNSSKPSRVRVIVTNKVLNTFFIYEQ